MTDPQNDAVVMYSSVELEEPTQMDYPRAIPSSSPPPYPVVISSSGPNTEEQGVMVGLLVGSILILAAGLILLAGPMVYRYVKSKIPVSQKRINRRYETIERWLITKRVRCHDDKCRRCAAKTKINRSSSGSIIIADDNNILDPSSHYPTTVRTVDTEDDDDDDDDDDEYNTLESGQQDDNDDDEDLELATTESPLECSICLEPFQTGEIISYSTNPKCNHVHHHECLKEWLLRRASCPSCRKAVLAVDCHGTGKFRADELERFVEEWRHRMLSTYFCLEEGLVVLDEPMSVRELNELSGPRKEVVMPCVKREELRERRGGRPDGDANCSSLVLDDEECAR